MGDLSPHFSADEFKCKDGSEHPIDPRLIEMLETIRAHFGRPVIITSGYRSPKYNRRVGGARNSFHTKGMAADIQVQAVAPREVFAFCDREFVTGGVGRYDTFTHVDCRPTKARWQS